MNDMVLMINHNNKKKDNTVQWFCHFQFKYSLNISLHTNRTKMTFLLN